MPVLLPQWLIEAELAAYVLDVLGTGAGLDQQAHRIASDAHEQEDRDRQKEQRQQGVADATRDILFHGKCLSRFPPLRGVREGEVSPSYGDGGVMSPGTVAHDPSARCASTSPARSPRWGGKSLAVSARTMAHAFPFSVRSSYGAV